MKIQDIMTRNPRAISPATPAREAARLMKEGNIGVLPVVENESSRKLVGIVTDRDLALRIVAEGKSADTPVRDVMSQGKLATRKPDEDVDDAMETMASEQVRRLPVVDERGSLVGIVSQADVVRKASNDKKAERTVERISEPGGQHSA